MKNFLLNCFKKHLFKIKRQTLEASREEDTYSALTEMSAYPIHPNDNNGSNHPKSYNSSRSGSQRTKSINSVAFQYNVKMDHKTCCSLCSFDLFMSCILFLCDISFEIFLILQWINNKYYISVLTLIITIFISNICNLYQWYYLFNKHTTFKWCNLIIIFGLIGLLPWFTIIYYLCHSSCCARIGIFNKDHLHSQSIRSQSQISDPISVIHRNYGSVTPKRRMNKTKRSKSKSKSYKNGKNGTNDTSELLLPSYDNNNVSFVERHYSMLHAHTPKIDVYHELLSNVTQLLVIQAFVRYFFYNKYAYFESIL